MPSKLNEQGQEIPDDTPIVIHVRQKKITQFDDVRAFIKRELSDTAARSGRETFEEANDFDVDDDPIPQSAHEYTEEQEEADRETIIRYNQEKQQKKAPPSSQDQPPPSSGSASSGTPPAATPAAGS